MKDRYIASDKYIDRMLLDCKLTLTDRQIGWYLLFWAAQYETESCRKDNNKLFNSFAGKT